MKSLIKTLSLLGLSILMSPSFAEGTHDWVAELQTDWAVANYQLEDKEKKSAFKQLLKKADEYVEKAPKSAELITWHGIINSTYAGVKGGMGALKYAKIAKKDFETAISINPKALNGSAYTSLGVLYYKVPGWPFGFGDDDEAVKFLKLGLAENPNGIDSNYFYADYLYEEGEYDESLSKLTQALMAPERPNRVIADQGRRKELAELQKKVDKKLKR